MKTSGALIRALIGLALLAGFTESRSQEEHSDEKLISVSRDIMTASGTCALITLDEQGRARVRTMDPFTPDEDFVIRLGTNPRSRKVDQIKNDPRVTLYYSDPDPNGPGYVMIHGKATLIDDPEQKAIWWKEEWTAFYENKEDDYLLIKVVPEWLEVVSYKHDIPGDSVTWKPVGVTFE